MEKLIRFQHESEPNSVALLKALRAPISCPQIFAGHYRGEDFNLVIDVGSGKERHKGSLCSSEEFIGNGTYHLGRNFTATDVSHSVASLYTLYFS